MSSDASAIWTPGEPAEPYELEALLRVVDPDGKIVDESDWIGNAYFNEGKAEVLNDFYREQTPVAKYMGCLNDASVADSDTVAGVTELRAPGVDGYARIQLVAATWSTPSDPGDGNRQISYPEQTFGPATGSIWNGTHVFGTTTSTGTGGLALFYVAQVFQVQVGQSLKVTLRQKSRSS